jgi:hypothetical protein
VALAYYHNGAYVCFKTPAGNLKQLRSFKVCRPWAPTGPGGSLYLKQSIYSRAIPSSLDAKLYSISSLTYVKENLLAALELLANSQKPCSKASLSLTCKGACQASLLPHHHRIHPWVAIAPTTRLDLVSEYEKVPILPDSFWDDLRHVCDIFTWVAFHFRVYYWQSCFGLLLTLSILNFKTFCILCTVHPRRLSLASPR